MIGISIVGGGVGGAIGFFGLYGLCRLISRLAHDHNYMFLMWASLVIVPIGAILGGYACLLSAMYCVQKWMNRPQTPGFAPVVKSDRPEASRE